MPNAQRSDWKTQPMPDACARVAVGWPFHTHDVERMRAGLVPQQMEDKWFIFWEDGSLYFHRSWTGFCLYILRFQQTGDAWSAVECTINREPEQYSATDDDYDLRMLSFLIDCLLLGRPAAFPSKQSDPGMAALEEWHIIGRAMLEDRGEQPG